MTLLQFHKGECHTGICVFFFLSKQEVMEKYEIYRDSVDCLPSCQLEVQLYQKKIQDLADNREKLTTILKEVCIVWNFYAFLLCNSLL